MHKRGQVAIFIICGIVILFLLSLLLLTVKNTSFFKADDREMIISFTNSCIESTAAKAVTYAGHTGGYIDVPAESIHLKNDFSGAESDVSYYYFFGKNLVPALNTQQGKGSISKHISKYVEDELDFCINDFYQVKKSIGKEITRGIPVVETLIADNKVIIKVKYRVNTSSVELENFQAQVPSRLGKLYGYSSSLVANLDAEGNLQSSYSAPADADLYVMPFDSIRTVYGFKYQGDDSIFLFAVAR